MSAEQDDERQPATATPALTLGVAPLEPPADRQAAAAMIASVHGEAHALVHRHEDVGVIAAADSLALFTTRGNATSTRLLAIRLWKVDALVNLGRLQDALAYLAWIEEFNGVSPPTGERRARICSFLGDHDGSIAAVDAAAPTAEPEAGRTGTLRRLCHLKVEALCALGRHAAARQYLVGELGTEPPTYDDMRMLRLTVESPAALAEMTAFLEPYFTEPGPRARASLFHVSFACRDLGLMDRAIRAARQRFLSGVQVVGFGDRVPPPKDNWARQAALALLDLQRDLHALGREFFLVSGTLLGCVRDRDIIGHDKDIDVGVMIDGAEMDGVAWDLRAALAATGRFKVRQINAGKLVQVQHANGVMIDVFLHWREDGLIYHEGQKTRWWNSEFALQPAQFLGETFMIPTDPEKYLDENYGPGWAVPEPDFETFTDTPNMIVQDDDHMRWYFYTKLYDYYFAGKIVPFQKVWAALDALVPGDGLVRATVHRVVSYRAASAA